MGHDRKLYRNFKQKSHFYLFLVVCVAFSILLPTFSFAGTENKPTLYQIDVVIFQQKSARLASPERVNYPVRHKNTVDLNEQVADPEIDKLAPFQLLANDDKKLDRIVKRLKQHHYPILREIAWLQPLQSSTKSPYVHFLGGNLLNRDDKDNTMREAWSIDGFIRAAKFPTYYAIKTDVTLTEPFSELRLHNGEYINRELLAAEGLTAFAIHQEHHVHLNKIEYFDHPNFGMLVMISPNKKHV